VNNENSTGKYLAKIIVEGGISPIADLRVKKLPQAQLITFSLLL
jgi:hypothetical protein